MSSPSDPLPPVTARPPRERILLVLLITCLVSAGILIWIVAATVPEHRPVVALAGGAVSLLLCTSITTAVHATWTARLFRQRATRLEADLDGRVAAVAEDHAAKVEDLRAEVDRITDHTLPEVVRHIRDGASAETALAKVEQPADPAQRRLLEAAAREIHRGERMRAATMSACANAAGRVQALTTSMLADLREMENRHDEKVLGDLLKIDHSTAQAGRLADSIAVLTGARSGRRWTKPIPMESVLRGALGRISAYQRVRTHSTCTSAVVGYAAEGIMHVLAEIMDNATNFSPPSEEVHVYVQEVHAGVVVTVEDSGLGMSEVTLRRAEQAVSAEAPDLTSLYGTRLGLTVVGSLARKHGLTVSFRPSSRGGTGVVIMIPQRLITMPREEEEPPRRTAALAQTLGAPAASPGDAAVPGFAAATGTSTVAARTNAAATVSAAPSASDDLPEDDEAALRTRPDDEPRIRPGARPGASFTGPSPAAPTDGPTGGSSRGDAGAGTVAGSRGRPAPLPKRTPGSTLARAAARRPPAELPARPRRPGAGTGFAAFREATRSGGTDGVQEKEDPASTSAPRRGDWRQG